MTVLVEVVAGRYFDSVRLMQVSGEATGAEGVEAALVAMATDVNLDLLAEMGFDPASVAGARADDLVIAIRARDEDAAAAARAAVESALAGAVAPAAEGLFAPPSLHTVAGAGRSGGATIALISVPGPHAFVEAMDALRSGLHVMVFSDNVPVDQEVLLKQEADARGLLVMGPDCGTAIVNGVGLGFANAVHPGPVAVTGASGTGIQQLCCLLDAAGVGVRHALGTGSRDLSAAVGAASTLRAISALDADPAVELIVVVSKPPDPNVAAKVAEAVAVAATPVVTALLGAEGVTLEGAAAAALQRLQWPVPEWPRWDPIRSPAPRPGALRGLFSGGTLRDEARAMAVARLGAVGTDPDAPGHRMVDFGSDEFTRGRAHPMIDPGRRLEAMAEAIEDPATGIVLFDVVLGYGAHPDPAAGLAPLVAHAIDAGIPVVASLCGTEGDPQRLSHQAETLRAAGACVYASNAAAARRAVALAAEGNR